MQRCSAKKRPAYAVRGVVPETGSQPALAADHRTDASHLFSVACMVYVATVKADHSPITGIERRLSVRRVR